MLGPPATDEAVDLEVDDAIGQIDVGVAAERRPGLAAADASRRPCLRIEFGGVRYEEGTDEWSARLTLLLLTHRPCRPGEESDEQDNAAPITVPC